jgi:hypothetical protein
MATLYVSFFLKIMQSKAPMRTPGEYLANSGEVLLWAKAGYENLWFTCGKFLHRQILSFSLTTIPDLSGNHVFHVDLEFLGYLVKRRKKRTSIVDTIFGSGPMCRAAKRGQR